MNINRKKSNYIKTTLLVSFCTLGVHVTNYAQLGPSFENFQQDEEEAPAAPIDGFTGLAVIAGAAYGIKKIKRTKKNHF